MKSALSIENRYIELLKNSILNELYIENEVRFLYVFAMLHTNQGIDHNVFRNIGAAMPEWVEHVRQARQDGRPWWTITANLPDGSQTPMNLRNYCEFSHSMVGRKRLDNIEYCLDIIHRDKVSGDIAETGVWRGGASIFMKGCLAAWNMTGRRCWVADSFEGLPVPTRAEDKGYDFSAANQPILAISLEEVRENFRRYGLLDDDVVFLKGWFRDTLPSAPIERLSLLRLDGDLYESTMDALDALYDKVSPGGFIIVDDYGDFEPCRRAVTEFREARSITDPIETIDWAGSFWRKAGNE